MKAVGIEEHGGLDAIKVLEIPEPRPAPGEVLVHLQAAALNHLDIWVRNGRKAPDLPFPHVLGSDGCGTVEAVASDVINIHLGQQVVIYPGLHPDSGEYCLRGEQNLDPAFGIIGATRSGTFAEKITVPAQNIFAKPSRLSAEETAALPVAYLTAWRMLMTRAALVPGETVLIHGIGGGVALAALQLAKLASARVIVTSSSDAKLLKARLLGADEGVNYKTNGDSAGWIRNLTGGRGVDIIIDSVGAATWPLNFAVIRKGGRIVHCGVTTGATVEANLSALYWNQITIMGSTLGSYEDFRQLLNVVENGRLSPVIDSVYPLDQAKDAMDKMEKGQQFGKLVLKFN